MCNLLLRNASQFVPSSSGACFQGRAERYLVGKGGGPGVLKNMEHRHQYFHYKNVGDGGGGGGGGWRPTFFCENKTSQKCYNEGLKILFHTFFRPQCFLVFLNI